MTSQHVIEILHTERCQFLAVTVERVRHALFARAEEVEADVRIVLVSTFAEALTRRFRGSPTVRIDGIDVDTPKRVVAPIGLLARAYVVDGRIERAPTVQSIQIALDRLVSVARARRIRRIESATASCGSAAL